MVEIKNALKRIDPRVFPNQEMAKKFKDGCGRRYINVGISVIQTYHGMADAMKDKELKDYAKRIEKAVYEKDGDNYDIVVKLFQTRMKELGAWKSVEGMGKFQKAKVLAGIRKYAKQQQKKVSAKTKDA
jgi:hypothetical protein